MELRSRRTNLAELEEALLFKSCTTNQETKVFNKIVLLPRLSGRAHHTGQPLDKVAVVLGVCMGVKQAIPF